MTDTETRPGHTTDAGSGGADEPPTRPTPGRRRRRRPAPSAHPFFRFVFPLFVIGAGVFVFVLWREGSSAVLDSTDGVDVTIVDDPNEPGFLAFADPTPTLLVALTDDDDNLVSVAVLARTALEQGGSLTLMSRDMLLGEGESAAILAPIYANDGLEGLELAVGRFFGIGFTSESLALSTTALEEWFKLVEPIPYQLSDDLVVVNDDGTSTVAIPAGARSFDAATLAEAYAWRNDTEFDAQRFNRQLGIWEAWIDQIAAADDIMAATLPFAEGISPFLRSLAVAGDMALVPMEAATGLGGDPIYFLAEGLDEWPAERTVDTVLLPIGFQPGARPTVQLLDGIGNQDVRDDVLSDAVAAGAEIKVVGNALAFDVADTVVAYHEAGSEGAANALAQALGAEVVFEELLDQPVELTVTIGSDMEAE